MKRAIRTILLIAVALSLLNACRPPVPVPPPDVLPTVNVPPGNLSPAANDTNTTPAGGLPPSGGQNVPPTAGNDTSPGVRGPNEIWIEGHSFSPGVLNIAVGTTVTWKNKDGEFHTVTSDGTLFNAGLAFTQQFQFTFTKAGIYNYHCDPHPDMTGTIYVK